MTPLEVDAPVQRAEIRSIMLATDFSPVCLLAAKYAASLAARFGARLYLTHVLVPEDRHPRHAPARELIASQQRNAEQQAAEIAGASWMQGVATETLTPAGYLIQTLEQLILDKQIGLVVVGRRPHPSSEDVAFLPVAELLSQSVACPILSVGPGVDSQSAPSEWRNILFATDFGRPSQHAAPYAACFAQKLGALLITLHALAQVTPDQAVAAATMTEVARIRLKESFAEGANAPCKIENVVVFGDPAERILRLANERKADLIVMGAKSMRTAAVHLPGAAVRTVALAARCPVLTVNA